MRLTSCSVEPGRCMHAKTSICDERMLCRLYCRLATMWQISNSSHQLRCFIGRLRLFRPLNFQQLTVPSCGGYLLFSRASCYCFLLNICSERQNCLEFSIAWGRLKISGWPFFEAYLINSRQFSKVKFFAFHSPAVFRSKRKPKIFWFENAIERGIREILTVVKL